MAGESFQGYAHWVDQDQKAVPENALHRAGHYYRFYGTIYLITKVTEDRKHALSGVCDDDLDETDPDRFGETSAIWEWHPDTGAVESFGWRHTEHDNILEVGLKVYDKSGGLETSTVWNRLNNSIFCEMYERTPTGQVNKRSYVDQGDLRPYFWRLPADYMPPALPRSSGTDIVVSGFPGSADPVEIQRFLRREVGGSEVLRTRYIIVAADIRLKFAFSVQARNAVKQLNEKGFPGPNGVVKLRARIV